MHPCGIRHTRTLMAVFFEGIAVPATPAASRPASCSAPRKSGVPRPAQLEQPLAWFPAVTGTFVPSRRHADAVR
jgi:hypothetical protein